MTSANMSERLKKAFRIFVKTDKDDLSHSEQFEHIEELIKAIRTNDEAKELKRIKREIKYVASWIVQVKLSILQRENKDDAYTPEQIKNNFFSASSQITHIAYGKEAKEFWASDVGEVVKQVIKEEKEEHVD